MKAFNFCGWQPIPGTVARLNAACLIIAEMVGVQLMLQCGIGSSFGHAQYMCFGMWVSGFGCCFSPFEEPLGDLRIYKPKPFTPNPEAPTNLVTSRSPFG